MSRWQEITIDQWIEIQELRSEELTGSEFFIEASYILDPGFDDDELTAEDLRNIRKELSFINTTPTPINPQKTVEFRSLPLGKFIDLETYLTKHPLHDKIFEVGDILFPLRVAGHDKIVEVIGGINDYLKYRENLLDKYKGIFQVEEDEDYEPEEGEEHEPEEDTPESKWGWLAVVYNLAAGDITKVNDIMNMPHIMVLNWASMRQDFAARQPKRTAQRH